ncbi:MAG: hypothetical protein JSS70_19230 [Bacteroidetes bacterium]|nr:hypothetical protein [Bacteroidota bacterium]
MERIQVLISKLNDQFQQKADPAQMLVTVQLLQAELGQQQVNNRQTLGTSKVAVVLPKSSAAPVFNSAEYEKYGPKPKVAQPVVAEQPVEVAQETEEKQYNNYIKNNGNGSVKRKEQGGLLFDPLVEIPTLSHQNGVKEINESVSSKQESLNDKLRRQSSEVGEILKESPIKDLRKAIGINDRFVFITELFRGDEAMYERSIKTINSFNIFPEAQYWINRELIVKLGWDVDAETVKHFYQLVKRRFI